MGIVAQVYTAENISEGIPSGKWEYRLLLEDDQVRLVEAYHGSGYCDVDSDILDPDVFQTYADEDDTYYSHTNQEEYISFIFRDLFELTEDVTDGIPMSDITDSALVHGVDAGELKNFVEKLGGNVVDDLEAMDAGSWSRFYQNWLKDQYND